MTITAEQVASPAEDSPERLRERREALGLSRRGMAVIVQRHETGDVHWEPEDIRICEIPASPPRDCCVIGWADEWARPDVAWYCAGAWWSGCGSPCPEITHWQPLPAAPEAP